MKYLSEYRDSKAVKNFATAMEKITTKKWKIMEVCGGQTHSIVKYGIDELIPKHIELIHGPGCPVCVTPIEIIDQAIEIAKLSDVIFTSFGDMLRVPGSDTDLLRVKAVGGDIRIVYSPLDALKIARENKDKEVVFFAVGFETTAPANAMAVYEASKTNVNNFSLLVSHVLVPPAIEAILSSAKNTVQGFLAAGHVCTIMGYEEYIPLAAKYKVPIVVTGFEPLDIMQGIYMCIKQLEENRHEVENQYIRSVKQEGNLSAKQIISEIFQIIPRKWRGIGEINQSGFSLSEKYKNFDAEKKFNIKIKDKEESSECISGLILQGLQKPTDCPAFRNKCTPENPLGATMVSSEGACAAYYRYKRANKILT